MSDCIHCWHDTGYVLDSYPEQYQLLCCHCGERQNISKQRMLSLRFDSSQPIQDSERSEHGEFVLQLPINNRYVKMVELQAAQMSEETKPEKPEPTLAEQIEIDRQHRHAEANRRISAVYAELGCAIIPTATLTSDGTLKLSVQLVLTR
jgi:hypothetical protein